MSALLNDPTFWVAIAFFVFVGLIVWKARTAILNGIDARAERIKAELDEAQRLREEAQKTLAEYKRKQRDAAKEAEDLKATLARREKAALEKIAQAEAQAVQDVRAQAVDIAMAATAKLLSESVDPQRDQAMVDQAIKDLGQKLH
jgi:F-type H+-transporting ATPase subunit b